MLEVYSDESESQIIPLSLIGGWVGDADRWAELTMRWEAILTKYRVGYFHTHTFKNARSFMYRHLSRADRDSMFISLLMLIKESAMFGQVAWVKPALYNRVTTKEFRSRHGTAYASLLGDIAGRIGLTVTAGLSHREVVSFYLESGHRHANEAIQFIRQYKLISTDRPPNCKVLTPVGNRGLRFSPFKIGAIGLGDKAVMKPLQAADVLSYCSLSLIKNPNDGFAKGALAAIDLPIDRHELTEEDIARHVEMLKETDEDEVRQLRIRRARIRELRKLGVEFEVLPDGLFITCDDQMFETVENILRSPKPEPFCYASPLKVVR